MSVTITFEKKHFLMTGLIIALPFMILAIGNIFAATTMPIVGHPISELFVDSDLDMNTNKIINSGNITLSAGNGILFPDGSMQETATQKSTYQAFAKCVGCTDNADSNPYCDPPDESADPCPIGWTDLYFAKHDTDFATLGSLYTEPMTVNDISLSASHAIAWDNTDCSATADVVDASGTVIATYTASLGAPTYSRVYCKVWCSYRICQKN